jgi:hypothetical protein
LTYASQYLFKSAAKGHKPQTLVIESIRLDGAKQIPALNIRFYALSLPLFAPI